MDTKSVHFKGISMTMRKNNKETTKFLRSYLVVQNLLQTF